MLRLTETIWSFNQLIQLKCPKIFKLSEFGISIDSFVLNKPTLDDVFISYTGHNLRDDTTGKFNKRKEFNQSSAYDYSDTYAIFWREMKRYSQRVV